MCKYGLPDPQLKLMQEIRDEHREEVEPMEQKFGESILKAGSEEARTWDGEKTNLTRVGTSDCGFRIASTAAP